MATPIPSLVQQYYLRYSLPVSRPPPLPLRPDTFSLGVCNGCQLMALLGWIGDLEDDEGDKENSPPRLEMQAPKPVRFTHNKRCFCVCVFVILFFCMFLCVNICCFVRVCACLFWFVRICFCLCVFVLRVCACLFVCAWLFNVHLTD